MEASRGKDTSVTREVLDCKPYLAGSPPGFAERTDVLLLLKDNKALRAHSQFIANHSAVLDSMLADLTCTPSQPMEVPVNDFTGEECTDLLRFLYGKLGELPDASLAYMIARFAHKYDAQHALGVADNYLSQHIQMTFTVEGKLSPYRSEHSEVFMWLSRAEDLALHRLAAYCERFIAVHWEHMNLKHPEQIQQLSSSVIIRITTGIYKALGRLQKMTSLADISSGKMICEKEILEYVASANDFLAWGKKL